MQHMRQMLLNTIRREGAVSRRWASLWTRPSGVRVQRVLRVLRFDAPIARGLWYAPSKKKGAIMIKPLQPRPWRERKTSKPRFARWKCNRVEIIHPSHTTVRTVRYTAVQFFGQEYIPACHFFRFLKIILSTPFRIFASSAIFRQEVSPLTAFCFNV